MNLHGSDAVCLSHQNTLRFGISVCHKRTLGDDYPLVHAVPDGMVDYTGTLGLKLR
jgi:hypothetical protein